MAKSHGIESRRCAVLFTGCDERCGPCVIGMEIGKGSQRRCRFDLSQTVEPLGERVSDLVLDLDQSSCEPQIPRTQRIDPQMNKRMGFDADRVECPRSTCEMQRGTGRTSQI